MATLNHVSMWSKHGWTRVTAAEAAKIHPGGTVSAHSGLFMCELCGQYVTLTEGYEKARHFRHSAYEESKNCPERTFGPLYAPTYKANEHELPIRLIKEENTFRLELGLLYVPQDIIKNEQTQSVTIIASDVARYTYSFERFSEKTITYLPVGNVPSEKYEVLTSNRLMSFWPRQVKGINRKGSLFQVHTGKMMTVDSDILVEKEYYLLTTRPLYYLTSSITFSLQCEIRSGWNTWRLYLIKATALDQDAAKFFLSMHYRLTDSPLQVNPIWPIHIKTPYVLKLPDDYFILHLSGRREKRITTFPYAPVRSQICSKHGQIYKIDCNGRQQLISSGQANVLQYLYLWKEPLTEAGEIPTFQVQDINGHDISGGQHFDLPAQKMIKILLPYDGKAVIRRNGVILEKRNIVAQSYCSIDRISLGTEIEICIGLDTVWVALFKRDREDRITKDDALLLAELNSFRGNEIPVPHSVGSLAQKMINYPQTKKWLYQIMRRGTAPEKSIKHLKNQFSAKEKE